MSEIFKAMNQVMTQVGYVQKQRGKNLNYSYAGEAALIEAIRPAMVDNGLFVFPAAVKAKSDTYTTARGSIMNRAVVTVTYRFAHVSGETFDIQVTGEGSDIGDKSYNKAMTGAYKYALRQSFCIETGDDPGNFASEPTEAMKKAFHAIGSKKYGDAWDDKRSQLVKAISKKRDGGPVVTSSNELYRAEMAHLIDGMEASND